MRNRTVLILALATILVIVGSAVSLIIVRAQPDFTISASPSTLTISTPGTGNTVVTVTSVGGFFGTVILTVSSSPAGLASTCNPSSLAVTIGGSANSTCSFTCTTPNTYTVVISGQSGVLSHSTIVTVTCQPTTPPPQQFTYTAKWICNPRTPGTPFNPTAATVIGLVPGEYRTDINVHNPSHSQAFNLTKHLVVSINETRFVNATRTANLFTRLGPDGAFYMPCQEILNALGITAGTPVKGFLVITTTTDRLDVVAEYSSETYPSGTSIGLGIALEVVTVKAEQFVP